MEEFYKGFINEVISQRTEEQKAVDTLQEAEARRKELIEKARKEEFSLRRVAREAELKQEALDILAKHPFATNDVVELSSHYYDSDDGCGESIDTKWFYQKKDGVTVIAKEEDRDDFGWSGSRKSKNTRTWVAVEDADKPITTEYADIETLKANKVTNPGGFAPDSWHGIKKAAEELRNSYRHQELIGKADELVETHGKLERLGLDENGKLMPYWDKQPAVYRKVIDVTDNGTATRLTKRDDWRTPSYYLSRKIAETGEGYQIELQPDNTRPRIRKYPYNAAFPRQHHLELFEEGLHDIEQSLEPTLFDTRDF